MTEPAKGRGTKPREDVGTRGDQGGGGVPKAEGVGGRRTLCFPDASHLQASSSPVEDCPRFPFLWIFPRNSAIEENAVPCPCKGKEPN